MASGSRTEQLKKLNVPALVVHGDADILIKPESGRHTADCIPRAEFKLIEGWGHNMPISAVPTIAGVMIDFINRVEAARKNAA